MDQNGEALSAFWKGWPLIILKETFLVEAPEKISSLEYLIMLTVQITENVRENMWKKIGTHHKPSNKFMLARSTDRVPNKNSTEQGLKILWASLTVEKYASKDY